MNITNTIPDNIFTGQWYRFSHLVEIGQEGLVMTSGDILQSPVPAKPTIRTVQTDGKDELWFWDGIAWTSLTSQKSRFGVEDNTATEDRNFNLNGHYLDIVGVGLDVYMADREFTVATQESSTGGTFTVATDGVYLKHLASSFGQGELVIDEEGVKAKHKYGNSLKRIITSVNGTLLADDNGNVTVAQGLQATLDADATLTKTNTIQGGNFPLILNQVNQLRLKDGGLVAYANNPLNAADFTEGVNIPTPSFVNYARQLVIDQPNSQIYMRNGNSDNGSGLYRGAPSGYSGGRDFGELRIFSNLSTFGTAPGISQAFTTFYVGGVQAALIRETGQVGIGVPVPSTAGVAYTGIHSGAILQLDSVTKGFMLPRVTNGQRSAIPVDINAKGLMIYNTENNRIESYNGSQWQGAGSSLATTSIGLTLDGGGSTLLTGQKGYIHIPYSGTITGWVIISRESSGNSATFDVWKKAGSKPSISDTITPTTKPSISGVGNTSGTVTSWSTTAIAAGDIIGWNLDSVSGITWCVLQLTITKT